MAVLVGWFACLVVASDGFALIVGGGGDGTARQNGDQRQRDDADVLFDECELSVLVSVSIRGMRCCYGVELLSRVRPSHRVVPTPFLPWVLLPLVHQDHVGVSAYP